MTKLHLWLLALGLAVLSACSDAARYTITDASGPTPVLPQPSISLIPTINIAPASGWVPGKSPVAASGLVVSRFAEHLDHPRWLLVLPTGEVLVAETNGPPRPDESRGLKAKIMNWFMRRAGAKTPSANRITLLQDLDGDGVAESRTEYLSGLNSPFGMALAGQNLYVADTDALLRFPYVAGAKHVAIQGALVTPLPAGTRNHHWTKNVIVSADGSKLFVTVGSNSNVAEHGMDIEAQRASIWEVDAATGEHQIFASGLRNPNGMAWEPATSTLWTVVNERDELGSDLVPDYLTSVRKGGFYGWPYSYYGAHVDERVRPQRPELVATALVPDYALGSHTASLGLADAHGSMIAQRYGEGMVVSQHGSWNRRPFSGYRVIFVPFRAGRPAGESIELLGGFVNARGQAQGRPVGVAIDKGGALLVADDVGNIVWRVSAASPVLNSATTHTGENHATP